MLLLFVAHPDHFGEFRLLFEQMEAGRLDQDQARKLVLARERRLDRHHAAIGMPEQMRARIYRDQLFR